MKPKYIFSAVFAICLLMGGLLPRIASPHNAVSAAAPRALAPSVTLPIASPKAPPASTDAPTTVAPYATTVAPTSVAPYASTDAPTSVAPLPTIAPFGQPDLAAPADSAAPLKTLPPSGAPHTANLPDLSAFTASLTNGQANLVVGVYAPSLFALPVVQQPANDEEYVSSADQTVTQYGLAAHYGVTGLLAHNTLSGLDFFGLKHGQEVVLIYGDGRQARYKITGSQRYQALNPTDTHSDFVDLNGPGGQVMNYQQLFDRVYTHANQLVFQTCFEANGDLSWGRVFYLADPVA